MADAFGALLGTSSTAIASSTRGAEWLRTWGPNGAALATLLSTRNGFYSYDRALLVRPLSHDGRPLGIQEWNVPSLWRGDYLTDNHSALFFAEDVFGGQFCIFANAIATFEPETGSFVEMASTLEEWAQRLVEDAAACTGFPIAREWQRAHGPLQAGMRLIPKKPFVLGGEFTSNNLYVMPDDQGMRFRASIANQIRTMPDGARVVIKESRPNAN